MDPSDRGDGAARRDRPHRILVLSTPHLLHRGHTGAHGRCPASDLDLYRRSARVRSHRGGRRVLGREQPALTGDSAADVDRARLPLLPAAANGECRCAHRLAVERPRASGNRHRMVPRDGSDGSSRTLPRRAPPPDGVLARGSDLRDCPDLRLLQLHGPAARSPTAGHGARCRHGRGALAAPCGCADWAQVPEQLLCDADAGHRRQRHRPGRFSSPSTGTGSCCGRRKSPASWITSDMAPPCLR